MYIYNIDHELALERILYHSNVLKKLLTYSFNLVMKHAFQNLMKHLNGFCLRTSKKISLREL